MQKSIIFSFVFLFLNLFSNPAFAILNASMLRERDPQGPSRGVVQLAIKRGDWRATFCTATLISRNAIITAAHCFDTQLTREFDSFEIVFESFNNGESHRVSRKGLAHFSHPRYVPYIANTVLHSDVAVAFFEGDLPEGFGPVPYDTNTRADYTRKVVQVYGYGRGLDYTHELNENRVLSSDILRTAKLYISNNPYTYFKDRYYLVPHPTNPSFLCQGDSGGPEFLVTKKGFKIIGINSGGGIIKPDGSGAYTCKGPGVAAKVAPVAKWIQQTLQRNP